MSEIHEGGCLCGSVRVRTVGPPVKTTICHCRFCQRVGSSAFMVEPMFLKANVTFDGGPLATYDYRSPEHGRLLQVQFCPKCGNRLGLLLERFPALQTVYGGVFDDPNWFKPEWHIFTNEAVRWMQFPHDVACFAQHALRADGTPETPWQVPH